MKHMNAHMSGNFSDFQVMTSSPNSSANASRRNSDIDPNSLLNNREFQEILQEYFQNNTMTLDEFLENLPRFMMENYGNLQEADDDDDDEDAEDVDEDFDVDDLDLEEDEANFLNLLRRNTRGYRTEPQPADTSELLFRSLLAGRREAREIPLRNIVPRSPPPSPVPNIVNTAASIPFFQRNGFGPQVPNRPTEPRRIPSRLRSSTTTTAPSPPVRFDPNAPEEIKSPSHSPIDRNNELPVTSEFLRRYGHRRSSGNGEGNNNNRMNRRNFNNNNNNQSAQMDDYPER